MNGRGVIVLGIIFMVIMTSGVASAAKEMTLETDKSAYNEGEVVIITVTNNMDEVQIMPYGYWVEDQAGEMIYTPDILAYTPPMAPGDSFVYTWKQICMDGSMVSPGDYTIHTSWGGSALIKIFDTTTSDTPGHGKVSIDKPRPIKNTIFA